MQNNIINAIICTNPDIYGTEANKNAQFSQKALSLPEEQAQH